MDAIKKKVIADICGHPLVVWPGTIGLTALLASVVIGWSPFIVGAGIMACLVSGGMLATNLTLNLEKITQSAYEFQKKQQQEQLQKKINKLFDSLGDNGRDALKRICAVRKSIRTNIEQGIIRNGGILLDQANTLFDVCIKNLEHCRDISKALKQLNGKAKKEAETDYAKLIDEVKATAEHLSEAEQKYIALGTKNNTIKLEELRSELEQSLKVAEAVETQLSGGKTYDIEKFRKKQPREKE